ncbi:MAG: M18 family aminopeptidase [gamma proteobacterium symbiont of Bathyaustriella thionipta]|nr:M18 family aminopeptidase [gamma proteobacterium symbiont of Bathyaustriella thionipta]MCU7950816.1 M18 family aminopeptidase [gamma proteobacterium symbiont of Bathyaustriella thionipta]MCU7953376.1 M18 family aminopeptidase [gamma proteobacterium symbiont of Bathyaustriella thionipta]MCU7957328.1 M18 family aminopeptidase [gamma proteobacterium symbiont of Bathyaustriella thionipta]
MPNNDSTDHSLLDITHFNNDLFHFLDASPTPYHVVKNQIERLKSYGFQRLSESESWLLEKGQRYYVTRNDSSLIAFVYGHKDILETGVRMLGAHTDSPCLKVKPKAEIVSQSYLKLGVEVYGGALLNPWFDRDLSLAGKLVYQDSNDSIHSCLINFEKSIASIPSLAIHLDRDANKKRSINPQTDIPPVLMVIDKSDENDAQLNSILKQQAENQYEGIDIDDILDFELSFYDTQCASYVGLEEDFIASSRLDNLLSCYTGLQALLSANEQGTSLLICSDHEEVGSASTSGAQGTFLKSVLERLAGSAESMTRMIDMSMMISADNAHAIHPNFADKHDANHGPVINQGLVIKVNANQRYASNCETGAIFKLLANQVNVPVQNSAKTGEPKYFDKLTAKNNFL